jgi:hypothetical protein
MHDVSKPSDGYTKKLLREILHTSKAVIYLPKENSELGIKWMTGSFHCQLQLIRRAKYKYY